VNGNISIDFESNGATSNLPVSAFGRSRPPLGATQMHLPPSLKSFAIVFITRRLCFDFSPLSSGGFSMCFFE